MIDWADPEIYMWIGGICVLLCVVCFFFSAMLAAYLDVKVRPRIPMAWCHIHGHFPESDLLDLFPGLPGGKKCPSCYKDAVFGKGKK